MNKISFAKIIGDMLAFVEVLQENRLFSFKNLFTWIRDRNRIGSPPIHSYIHIHLYTAYVSLFVEAGHGGAAAGRWFQQARN